MGLPLKIFQKIAQKSAFFYVVLFLRSALDELVVVVLDLFEVGPEDLSELRIVLLFELADELFHLEVFARRDDLAM